jgi:hypothetical protein
MILTGRITDQVNHVYGMGIPGKRCDGEEK